MITCEFIISYHLVHIQYNLYNTTQIYSIEIVKINFQIDHSVSAIRIKNSNKQLDNDIFIISRKTQNVR